MTAQPTAFDVEQARFNMIEQQVRPWEVLDPQVLALLGDVKREHFVPEAHKALAFVDMDIPLTQPAQDGQCMLSPRVEARMVQDLQLQPTDKVLEIGTGSGFSAALMARLAKQVLSLEIDPALASKARTHSGLRPRPPAQVSPLGPRYLASRTAALALGALRTAAAAPPRSATVMPYSFILALMSAITAANSCLRTCSACAIKA